MTNEDHTDQPQPTRLDVKFHYENVDDIIEDHTGQAWLLETVVVQVSGDGTPPFTTTFGRKVKTDGTPVARSRSSVLSSVPDEVFDLFEGDALARYNAVRPS